MIYQKLKQCRMENSKTPDQTYWTLIESRTPHTKINRKHYSLKNVNQNQTIDCIPQIQTQMYHSSESSVLNRTLSISHKIVLIT